MSRPPKAPLLLLRLFAGKQIMEEIEGDLHEDFLDNLESLGPRKARKIYIWTAFRSLRPYILIHNKENRNPKLIDMVNYHLKMAFRTMSKKKTFSAINIFGLTLGMASSLAILLFIIDQSQMDNFQTNKERIYRLESASERAGNISRNVDLHGSLMPAIADNIPGIEAYARLSKSSETLVQYRDGNKSLIEEDFIFTDPDFFKVFSFEILKGDRRTILSDPNGVVVTQSAAKRYFGTSDPIGKIIEFAKASKEPRTITGIVADPLGSSSIQFDFIAPNNELFPSSDSYSFKGSFSISLPVYVLLDQDIQPATVVSKIVPELKKHTDKSNLIESTYSLQSFEELKYDMEVSDDIIAPVDKRMIFMFSIIAIFIISLAIINYVNLTSARSIQRTLEVGIRKVVGAGRRTLLAQFLTESFLTCFIALPLSILLLQLILPYLEVILERQLFFDYKTNFPFLIYLIAATIFIALLAGIYPAIILSRFNFSNFMKGRIEHGTKGPTLRKILVVFQFTFSIALIIGAILIQNQLDFVKDKTLGYAPEQIIVLKGGYGMFTRNHKAFKTELLKVSGVTKVAMASSAPGDDFFATMTTTTLPFPMVYYIVDEDYMDIFNLKILEGRNFSAKTDSSFNRLIINKTLANALEIKSSLSSDDNDRLINRSKIIGIMEDFHFESLHKDIQPVVLRPGKAVPMMLTKVIIKVETEDFQQVVSNIRSTWDDVYPEKLFDYEFLDDKLDRMYTAEYNLSKVFSVFTVLAILISCLGLFGLSMHMAQIKIKEISIRKVLGASITQIIGLLGQQVFVLIGIAALLATPLAYYFIDQWLQDFAYNTGISGTVFVFTLIMSLVLATITTGWHTIKTAYTNPAESLRNE